MDIINNFLKERQTIWLESRIKKASNDEEIALLQQEANEKFSMVNWLPDAARRAGWLSTTTHPSKFTHTSARTTPVNAEPMYSNDGLLRSGNILNVSVDATGNAAAMDVHKFLLLPVSESKTLLDAFEESDKNLKITIENFGLDFESIRADFLKMKFGDGVQKTDKLLKQVYFPIQENKYHLLSLLTPSGMIWELKNRIDIMRFSDETKNARTARRELKAHNGGYSELFDLTVIGYGGTKPQVVSVLNNNNKGKAYLLPCIPPLFEKRSIRLPTRDFLNQSVYLQGERQRFITLHQWCKQDRKNIEIKNKIKRVIQGIIDQVLYKAYQLRETYSPGWSESYKELPKSQRIWLDNIYQDYRNEENDWRNEIAQQMVRHLISLYEKINGINNLGDGEFSYINELIAEKLEQDKEFF